MRPGRTRPLTGAEARLWAEVARSIAPLKGRALPEIPAEAPPSDPPASGPGLAPGSASRRPRPALKPLAPLEPKTSRGMARGRVRPDAVLDLHGMRQDEAHAAISRFLARSQASGCRIVAIVTGKGRSDEAGREERGVLRRMAPHWLANPGLRPIVLGWEEAAPHRGGAGVLYVRLRRNRPLA